jgi:hypothetical protein
VSRPDAELDHPEDQPAGPRGVHEELLAETITGAVRELVAGPQTRIYVLTDVAGEHCWSGSGFIPADCEVVADDLVCFPSPREAGPEVRRHGRLGRHLKVAAWRSRRG